MKTPWNESYLEQFDIVGMNHYHDPQGRKMLFVAMVKDGICIKEEGPDDEYLWNRLYWKAKDLITGTAPGHTEPSPA